MRKVVIFSGLLILGLVVSQTLPALVGEGYGFVAHVVKFLTMVGLGYIMIHVGYEFEIDRSNLRQYGWDYVVAATAASFPWLFCAVYFIYVMSPYEVWGIWDTWKDALLASRFAAPTSAGVLFSMLAAAGLAGTWMYRKARILAVFDDLDTVLLMIPLKMMIVGFRWQLGLVVLIMVVQLWFAWKYLHLLRIPMTWRWVLVYAFVIAGVCEAIYFISRLMDEVVPIHIEVLLPAFVLGCMSAKQSWDGGDNASSVGGHEEDILETPSEKRVSTLVSGLFMVLVGLSLPPLTGLAGSDEQVAQADEAAVRAYLIEENDNETDSDLEQPPEEVPEEAVVPEGGLAWRIIIVHVLLITIISNLGKMFPVFCYRKEVDVRERLAVAIAMFPRGEVGAGVLVISLSYGIGGPMIIVAMFSLALNLLCTGLFIVVVKELIGVGRDSVDVKPV